MNTHKRYLFLMLILIFAFAFIGCSSSKTSAPAESGGEVETEEKGFEEPKENETSDPEDPDENLMEPITLSLADFFPATHKVGVQVIQGWADAVEEATDGLVKIDVYPGNTLLDSEDLYEGVISGVADIVHSSVAYNMGRFPIMGALYLGGIEFKNAKVSSYVAREMINEFDPEELHGAELMFLYGISPGDLQTKTPIRTLDDLQGMPIRATGNGVDSLKLLGAAPIAMPQGDAYEAISRGVVEGNLAPPEVLEGWNMAEVTNYITKTSFLFNSVHMVNMNKEVWESLPKSIQEAIEEVNRDMFENVASSIFDELNESAWDYTLNNFDVEVIELSEEEKARWLKALEPIHDNYIEETLNPKGLPGREIIDKIIELTEKYNNEF